MCRGVADQRFQPVLADRAVETVGTQQGELGTLVAPRVVGHHDRPLRFAPTGSLARQVPPVTGTGQRGERRRAPVGRELDELHGARRVVAGQDPAVVVDVEGAPGPRGEKRG